MQPTSDSDSLQTLVNLIENHQPVVALTGAGLSTGSGIPAYRDHDGNWQQPQPLQGSDFLNHASVRQRYWLRSVLGWPRFERAEPNAAHHALAALENAGVISTTITQNVDGLHQKAGSKHLIELHGSLARAFCLNCGTSLQRRDLQQQLLAQNPFVKDLGFNVRADGDAEPATRQQAAESTFDYTQFKPVTCERCGGNLKPDVVFYGENVPKDRVQDCYDAVAHGGLLLCIGTSLTVMSGFRFCRAALAAETPIAIVNQGKTRADSIATCCVNDDCADVLQSVCEKLTIPVTGQ